MSCPRLSSKDIDSGSFATTNRPFSLVAEKSTERNYRNVQKRLVRRECRSSDFGEAMDEVSARPEYQLLQDEAILFNASQSKEFDDEQDEDTDLMFGYDEVDRDNSEVASDQAEADENHHADQASKVWDESDTPLFIEFLELLYQVGILGFSEDCKQFLLARQFCPHLSGLIYIQRLLLMECALPLREYHGIAIPPRLHADQLDQLNSIREKYMITGTQYPLAEMVSLRDFGRNIARTEPPSLLFSWSDDGETIRHGDFQLTMDKFRQVPDYFISQAEEICDKLMFDLKPDIDLAMIKDDMANSSSGYSFVKHPANDLDKAYLDLLYSAYASRESKLSKDGRWIWKSMDSYLKQVTKLDEMLAGDLYTACGQTPRARDLFTLACESGPSTSCSISIWNGLMGYSFTCSGKPWCTSRLTSILKQATSGIWQREVNIRIFRQMAISITEKHFREVHSPLNTYDDTTADADLNAVFAWQSGDRPLQRGITYGLDGAFPNRLQPALLRSYEWASTRWHEFIHQPSRVISSPRGRTTSPSKLSLSIATLKRNFACLMQSDESLGYRSIRATDSNQRSKETNCGPPKTGGFRCTFIVENEGETSMCRFVGSDTRRIREHLKHEHGWDLGLKPGFRLSEYDHGTLLI
ncbi:hypothetical protein IWW34DRAFT_810134 [Fusarium oxysporum f. sp. albedinis]|nr:hypothetical protein IWW34DRAFT_810134 [Fusarium oxysporum f. sp. albedinis]